TAVDAWVRPKPRTETPTAPAGCIRRSASQSQPRPPAALGHAGPEHMAVHGQGGQRHEVEEEIQPDAGIVHPVEERPAGGLEPRRSRTEDTVHGEGHSA